MPFWIQLQGPPHTSSSSGSPLPSQQPALLSLSWLLTGHTQMFKHLIWLQRTPSQHSWAAQGSPCHLDFGRAGRKAGLPDLSAPWAPTRHSDGDQLRASFHLPRSSSGRVPRILYLPVLPRMISSLQLAQ